MNPIVAGDETERAEPATRTAGRARVLVVDDEPSILNAVKRVFRGQRYEVLTATSGKDGLALLEQEPVALVISDMRMPEMDGAQFLEQVFSRWPDTKRILLTGYADASATIAAINRGKIWRYVAKPWNDDELIITVEQALAHRDLMHEIARLTELTRQQNDELKVLNEGLEQKVAERTVQLQNAINSLKQGFVNAVHVFSGIMELHSGDLAGHSRRVAELTRKLAQRMHMSDVDVQDVFLAALLHDIGKIGMSESIITRAFNSLGADARAGIMKHPVKGELLLMPIEQLSGASLLIRHHHEQFDGQGYPDGKSGIGIPLRARVLAVANDYDALQHGTLVARRLTAADALRFLVANRSKRYDPSVVDEFSRLLAESRPEEFPELPLRPGSLAPGMQITRDLIHRGGYLLLASGHVLSQSEIEQLKRLETSEQEPVVVYVGQSL
jgi:response regulator RpfG family c-di-GMP phosphodiesterase